MVVMLSVIVSCYYNYCYNCYGPLSGTTEVSQYQKKHSPTCTYPDHQLSFISFLHLLRSIASSLFNLQSFCTTSVYNIEIYSISVRACSILHLITVGQGFVLVVHLILLCIRGLRRNITSYF